MTKVIFAALTCLVTTTCAGLADRVPVQSAVLHALTFAAAQDEMGSARWAEALSENAKRILYRQVLQKDNIAAYIALHLVPGALTYDHVPVTYERMAAEGDRAGIRHLVALLTGETRDLGPLADRVSCPQDAGRRICILSFGVFDVAGMSRDDVQFDAPDKVDVMRAFLLDLASEATSEVKLRFRSGIRIDASTGQLIERLPSSFETERFRIYDDEVQTGITRNVLPAAARGHEWLHPSVPTAGYLALSGTARGLETWVTDDVVSPSTFDSTGGAFSWNITGPDRNALVVDRSIGHLLTAFDAETLRAANAVFKNFEDVFVEIDLAFDRVAVADVSAYVAQTGQGANNWRVMSVHFARITGARILSVETDASLELQLE